MYGMTAGIHSLELRLSWSPKCLIPLGTFIRVSSFLVGGVDCIAKWDLQLKTREHCAWIALCSFLDKPDTQ